MTLRAKAAIGCMLMSAIGTLGYFLLTRNRDVFGGEELDEPDEVEEPAVA